MSVIFLKCNWLHGYLRFALENLCVIFLYILYPSFFLPRFEVWSDVEYYVKFILPDSIKLETTPDKQIFQVYQLDQSRQLQQSRYSRYANQTRADNTRKADIPGIPGKLMQTILDKQIFQVYQVNYCRLNQTSRYSRYTR